jgi:hypothetical protein
MFQTRRLQLKCMRINEKTFFHEKMVPNPIARSVFQGRLFATEGQARGDKAFDKSIAARRSLPLI